MGVTSRSCALAILQKVLYQKQNFEDVFALETPALDARDRALVYMMAETTFKRLGQINDLLSHYLKKPLPVRGRTAMSILQLGVTQLLFMNIPSHAAVSTSVDLAKQTDASFYASLINAILRQIDRDGDKNLSTDVRLNIPDWIYKSWEKSYGDDVAVRLATSFLTTPSVDVTVKNDAAGWAQKLNGTKLNETSVRLPSGAYIPDLPGFLDGQWWVQDAAAAIPATLFNNINGKKVADLCAAPGGKTAQLANAAAIVDAVDVSDKRIKRLKENLDRLHLNANLIVSDARKIEGHEVYDAILLDAPCSATGTLYRHPDVLIHRTPKDLEKLTAVQSELLTAAHRMLKKGGELVYCTCSLQTAEGEDVINNALSLFDILPIDGNKFLRTFPFDGTDGFFIAHLRKKDIS